MEEQERSRSRSPRRASRVEQVVGKWLRRSRDSLSRERILGGRKGDRSRGSSQQNFPVKVTVEVIRDSVLDSHGFSLTTQHPLLVRDVTAGGPADGKLLPGDQVLKVNSKATEDLQPEHVAEMIRECTDSVTMTILRQMSNPKSSFMSAEKRARLKRNPVKVRFAEEVVVNGHTQGNSLLFLPNVLKVYLENGQTKAFKFDSSTTVKDIVLTLKEKLSIHSIEYFSLVLEQQYSITKLLLLHEDEHIQKVVQKKDSHDYRCLFRVCFIPREPMELMQDDPVTFEYLFHQSVGDVLQERFAVEMKCNTALRLAALHMHERLASCGQPHRASVKSMAKEFGLESFISPTLLRNMREKDLRKALGYHLKKIQSLLEPHQKVISVSQARLAYLTQMAELISYSGRSYNATMLLQDRETLVSLLVGARYGLSQVLNHKINMISTIIDFHYITRVELLSESDRVSMMKIYLQDIHPLALLMDSVAAKDLACLLAGYCKLLVDPNTNVFHWGPRPKMRRIPADYGRRCGSDSEETSEEDYSMEGLLDTQLSEDTLSTRSNDGLEDEEEEEEQEMDILKKRGKEVVRREGRVRVIVTQADDGDMQEEDQKGDVNKNSVDAEEYGAGMDSLLQTGWYTDPRVNSSFSSLSSNSLNALEESNKAKPAPMEPVEEERQQSGSAKGLHCLDVHHPYLLDLPEQLQRNGERKNPMRPSDLAYSKHTDLCFAELSQMSDYLPSPPEASDDALSDDEENDGGDSLISSLSPDLQVVLASCNSNTVHSKVPGITVHALLARIRSHPACRQESRRNRRELETHGDPKSMAETPPPAPLRRAGPFQALNLDADARDSGSESEEEFFDAQDRLTPPVTEQNLKVNHKDVISEVPASKVRDVKISVEETAAHELEKSKEDYSKGDTNSLPNALPNGNNLNHDISIITTDHTHEGTKSTDEDHAVAESPSTLTPPRTPLQIKPVLDHHTTEQKGLQAHGHNQCNGDIPGRNSRLSSELLEMEPDTMEFKPVTSAGPPLSSPLITAVRQTRSQPKVTAVMGTLENKHTQKKGEPEDLPQKGPHLGDVTTTTPKETLKEQEDRRMEHVKSLEELKKQQSLPSHQLENGENKMSSLSVSLTPISTPLTPTSQASTDLEVTPKTEHKRNIPPNGLTVHSWHQRNGNTSPVFSKGVSLSQENLRSENPDSDVMVTSASTTPTPSPSPSVAVRGSITGDPKELVGTQGFSNRNSSSGRLSASALRGRIQDLPWYLTRSQEILGTIVLSSGDGSTESKAANTTDERQEPTKVSPKATSVPTLYAGKEEDAEVVIVKLKDGPQEGTSLLKEANGDLKAPPEMRRSESRDSSDMYRHLGTCQLDQPQSHRDSPEESGQGGPSSSSDAQPHREACGCRTVYANCFSGDSEDVCSFDDEMTVYEFSQRKQVNKPPQIPPAPSPLSLPMPSSNVLSLLRDSPRPLSCSTELSPLLTPPRPLEPRPPELGPQDDPLHSLKGKRYMMGQRGTGLKEAYASLHQDIDKLLTVLRNTSPAVTLPSNKEYCEKCKEANGNSLSETERCLLQAEARRLASGCQRATRVGWAPDDALFSLGNSFGALVHLASACLRVPCAGCGGCHGNIDGGEALGKIQEIVKLYKEFVVAVETAKEGEGVRLLAKQCTVLISTVFSLTQLFRTRTPDIDNGNVPLIF